MNKVGSSVPYYFLLQLENYCIAMIGYSITCMFLTLILGVIYNNHPNFTNYRELMNY